ncbi:aminotransferase class V-fold PLP-dependent enzyme [candidate division KSB1 bacterium]
MYPKEIQNFPDDISLKPRRSFLKSLAGSAAAAAALPLWACSEPKQSVESLTDAVAGIPADNQAGDEVFWAKVKNQFPVKKDLIMLNAANLCPSATSVQKRVFELTQSVDSDASFTNRGQFGGQKTSACEALAKYLGAGPEEIAITRNTSEGNNVVISGVELGRGDEVIIWDQNHPTANIAFDVRAERYGYTVKRVATPEDPSSPDDLIKPFTDAITGRTKMIAFSHVSNVSGQRIDAKKLCGIARERGILTLVDGAQTFGCYPTALHDMDCDFFTGSSHKWFCGPKEVGVLFVRKDAIPKIHPLIVGVGYGNSVLNSAEKFETLGQRDDSRVSAMLETVKFHDTITMIRVSTRIRKIADAVKSGLKEKLPDVKIVTPIEHEMSWGVVVFNVPGLDTGTALDRLYEMNIGCAVMGGNIRYSPHIYNTLDDINKSVDAIVQLV